MLVKTQLLILSVGLTMIIKPACLVLCVLLPGVINLKSRDASGQKVERGYVYKTTDGGASWSALNLKAHSFLALEIDPRNSSTLYASTSDGIFKSINAGLNWNRIRTSFESMMVRDLVVDPKSSATLYAGASNGIFKSTDGGTRWENVSASILAQAGLTSGLGMIRVLVFDPQNPSTIYAGADRGVFRSTNDGNSWKAAKKGLPNQRFFALAINPQTPTTVYSGVGTLISRPGENPAGGIFRSVDGGASWQAVANYIHKAQQRRDISVRALVIDPRNPSTVFASTAYGILKTTDAGATWESINSGLTNANVHDLAIDHDNPMILYAATFGGGIFKSTDGGSSWRNVGFENQLVDAMNMDPGNPAILYAGIAVGSPTKARGAAGTTR